MQQPASEQRIQRCAACGDRNQLCECPNGPTSDKAEARLRTVNRAIGKSLERQPPCPTCGEISDHDDHTQFGNPVRE